MVILMLPLVRPNLRNKLFLKLGTQFRDHFRLADCVLMEDTREVPVPTLPKDHSCYMVTHSHNISRNRALPDNENFRHPRLTKKFTYLPWPNPPMKACRSLHPCLADPFSSLTCSKGLMAEFPHLVSRPSSFVL